MSKQKYLVMFRRAAPQAQRETSEPKPASDKPSPEQMQKMFAAYNEWMEKFKDEILDPGAKLMSSGRVVTASGVADGPFAEAKEVVGGYMILCTESYEAAIAVMRAGPGAKGGGSFEIRELAGGM